MISVLDLVDVGLVIGGKPILHDLDLHVLPGEIHAILGMNGEKSRGLAKSRIIASDHCVSEVVGEAVGNAPGARGHVDCVEIVKGKDARVSAVRSRTGMAAIVNLMGLLKTVH